MSNQDDSIHPLWPSDLNEPLPHRTEVTHLTDDELLLMDALFDLPGISTTQLSAEDYPIHMNVLYTHNFSQEQLLNTLDLWKQQGLVSDNLTIDFDSAHGESDWELTLAGGELWEKERQPVWDRYVSAWTYYHSELIEDCWSNDVDNIEEEFRLLSGDDKATTIITSSNLAIVNAFAETAIACNLYPLNSPRQQHFVSHSFSVSYKELAEVHCLCLSVKSDLVKSENTPVLFPDWKHYERDCIWWRSISELNTLPDKRNISH